MPAMTSLNGVCHIEQDLFTHHERYHKEQEDFVPNERTYQPDERTFQDLLVQLSKQHDLEVALAAAHAIESVKVNGFSRRLLSPQSALRRTALEERFSVASKEKKVSVASSPAASNATSAMTFESQAHASGHVSPGRPGPSVRTTAKESAVRLKRAQSVTISEKSYYGRKSAATRGSETSFGTSYVVKSAATQALGNDLESEERHSAMTEGGKHSGPYCWVRGAFSTRTQSPKWFDDDDFDVKQSRSLPTSSLPISDGFDKPKMQRWREVVGEMRLIPARPKLFVAQPLLTNLFGYVRKSSASKSSRTVKKPDLKQRNTQGSCRSLSVRDALVNGDARVSRDEKISKFSVGSRADSLFQEPLFELHDMWNEIATSRMKSRKLRKVEYNRDTRLNPSDSNLTQVSHLVLKPQGYPFLLWTMLGLISIAYDFFTVPMLVFPLPSNTFTVFMARYSLVFWNIDLLVKFRTGFYTSDGHSEIDPRAIAANYLRTWFIVDVALVALEWFLFFVYDKDEITAKGSTGRLVQIARFFRMARLIRLVRMRHHMILVRDYLNSELAVARFTIGKTVLSVLALTHFIACIWYLIGEHISEHGWTMELHDCEFWCQYTTSLHWSVVQFGVGDSNIMPQSDGERTFNIVVLLFALVVFSSVVSSITHAMSQLGTIRHDQVMQFAMFHRFCRENHVSKSLTRRVQRHLEYAYDQRVRQIQIAEVPLFDLLSGPLKDEVLFSVWRPHVSRHPLFQRLCRRDVNVMHMLARSAFVDVHLAPSDVLFSFGQVAERMYFLAKGGFEYLSAQGHGHSTTTLWLCEAALWCPWVHVGELKGHTECKFVALNAEQFGSICGLYPPTFMRVRKYAVQFIDNLNQQTLDELTDVDEGLLVDAMHLSSTGDQDEFKSPASKVWRWFNHLLGREAEVSININRSETDERFEAEPVVRAQSL